ncbi:hypothetical protein NCER_101457 [Vairimorpha ceranae BRL01]|uniref:Uncharacterized protein n=2 Tax=Vairimorpha ceranae TaxID=40302 RepID=C4VA27_VAIC1|nr:hypothetical protein AAJ76_500061102 [Vairimorpha ceranae]EEQ81924.1 hypothetical protein NCER_101457 [Vairimorpha ceranae BRL01]KAF5141494.1 hypothetical protein G9O61_00g003570 [Vairimorpha ceranae]KKO76236.1 hypothetical protein AAJ76_500061102 [Vairimorpha ceranae]
MNIWFFIITVSSLNLSKSCYQENKLQEKKQIVTNLLFEIHDLITSYNLSKIERNELDKVLFSYINLISSFNCCCIDDCEYNSFITGIVKGLGGYFSKIFY